MDPSRFVGTVYRAAGWTEVGMTRGFAPRPGRVPRRLHAEEGLRTCPDRGTPVACFALPPWSPATVHGRPRTMLSAEQMRSLPDVCSHHHRPAQPLRAPLPPRDSAGAGRERPTLCGARGYKAIHEWVCDLSPAMLRHFRCRRVNGAYERPSIYCLRNAIVKVAPEELDAALRAWFSAHGHDDASLAIDGKTMKGAVDEAGRQVHILGACGHETADRLVAKKNRADR